MFSSYSFRVGLTRCVVVGRALALPQIGWMLELRLEASASNEVNKQWVAMGYLGWDTEESLLTKIVQQNLSLRKWCNASSPPLPTAKAAYRSLARPPPSSEDQGRRTYSDTSATQNDPNAQHVRRKNVNNIRAGKKSFQKRSRPLR